MMSEGKVGGLIVWNQSNEASTDVHNITYTQIPKFIVLSHSTLPLFPFFSLHNILSNKQQEDDEMGRYKRGRNPQNLWVSSK